MNYIKELINFVGVDFFIQLGSLFFAMFVLKFVFNRVFNNMFIYGPNYDVSDNSVDIKEYENESCSNCQLARMGYCDEERQKKFGVCDGFLM